MICQNCNEYNFFKDMEYVYVTSRLSQPLEYFSKYTDENEDQGLICDNCGNDILVGDLYFKNYNYYKTTKEEILQVFASVIMENIVSCTQCGHGCDMDAMHHSASKIFNEEGDDPEALFSSFHSSTELGQLIYDVIGLEDIYYDDIIKYISCPHCKNGSGEDYEDKTDYGEFDIYTEVYTKYDIKYFEEKFYEELYLEIEKEIERIADICSYDDLVKLKSEFLRNPLYILQNTTFGKIQELLEKLFDNEVYLLLHKSKRLYRARENDVCNVLFPHEKMWEAPLEKTQHNRYNISGLQVLYCSNLMHVLPKEVPPKTKNGYTFATMRVITPLKMFKIKPVFGYEFEGFIEEEVPDDCEKNAFKVQYIITNIIASIAKEIGYDGISYLSVKDKSCINYAIINYKKGLDIEIINTFNVYVE